MTAVFGLEQHGHPNVRDFMVGMALGLTVGMACLTFSLAPAGWTTAEPPSVVDPLKLN